MAGPNISAQCQFPAQFRVDLSRNELNSGFKTRGRYLCVNSVKGQEQHWDLAGKLNMCLTQLMSNNTKTKPHTESCSAAQGQLGPKFPSNSANSTLPPLHCWVQWWSSSRRVYLGAEHIWYHSLLKETCHFYRPG